MDEIFMKFMYGTSIGRFLLKILLKCGLTKIMAAFLRSSLSKPMIQSYIKKYNISLDDYIDTEYKNFASFFIRKKKQHTFDSDPSHFISPADSLLSVYPIRKDSTFTIKGSSYRLSDLIQDEKLAQQYEDGLCLVFRLTGSDYHHYMYVDDGYIHTNNYIEGELHSVQPIAYENYPVYRLNRRMWTLIDTDNFGPIVQIEIGALAVGGIVIEHENQRISKGNLMGRFELYGSSIAVMIQKDRIQLLDEITKYTDKDQEVRLKQGMYIGNKSI